MLHWSQSAVFYHVYPLGYCGAPPTNDGVSVPVPRLEALTRRLPRIAELGATALLLGPVFQSGAHGYDTIDFREVDRRLGGRAELRSLVEEARRLGLRVVFDGVFNHVGREHPWFRDLREQGPASIHRDKFRGLDFSRTSPYGDPFGYEGWRGCYDLVSLELGNAELRRFLVGEALSWIEDYDIDGIRIDAADLVSLEFQRELAVAVKARKADFWLLGEVVHGDYRRWLGPGLLDAVTNYECWKGLWSSLKDANYHEIAYSLNRQFGPGGLYRGLSLYSFADNHDVDRVASTLDFPAQLYPLHILLFTMPGIPSIYYGSEFGIPGRKEGGSDRKLRPSVEEVEALRAGAAPDLARTIARLSGLRARLPVLWNGDYRDLHVASTSFAFERRSAEGRAIVALNAAPEWTELELPLEGEQGRFRDLLDEGGACFTAAAGRLRLRLPPSWGRILAPA